MREYGDRDSRSRLAAVDDCGGEADGTAAAATGTGWATIKGRFVYDGAPPKMPPYAVTKDQATCAPGGKTPLQQTLVVDSGNGRNQERGRLSPRRIAGERIGPTEERRRGVRSEVVHVS